MGAPWGSCHVHRPNRHRRPAVFRSPCRACESCVNGGCQARAGVSAIISETSCTAGESMTPGACTRPAISLGQADPDVADLDGRGETPLGPGQAEHGVDRHLGPPGGRVQGGPHHSRLVGHMLSTTGVQFLPAHVELLGSEVPDRAVAFGVDQAPVVLGVDHEDTTRGDGDPLDGVPGPGTRRSLRTTTPSPSMTGAGSGPGGRLRPSGPICVSRTLGAPARPPLPPPAPLVPPAPLAPAPLATRHR